MDARLSRPAEPEQLCRTLKEPRKQKTMRPKAGDML